ncbi:kinase-like protein [Ceratobasidium sp. AG-I]|nr:kinase-like protein [Ceratobasidium sp. AG-I]
MHGIRDPLKRFLGLPQSPPRARGRASSPNPPTHSRTPSREEYVVVQDTILTSHSRSVTPMPDNEVPAQAPLSVQCTVSLATVLRELAPIPYMQPVADCLEPVFQAIENMRVNKRQWTLLKGRCVMVMRIAGAQVAKYGGANYPGIHDSAMLLQNTITNIGQRATYYSEMQGFLALTQFQSMSEEIRGYFAHLDVCLLRFSYVAEAAQMQWISEFSAVQHTELRELEGKLQSALEDKPGNQRAAPTVTYADAETIAKTLLAVTNLQLPPQLLVGEPCILEANVPAKNGTTCDIYEASFFGGQKVAKKVIKIGISEKEHVRKYVERVLRNVKLWASFESEYTLPFYGVGMETFEGDHRFQLYMVSPLMKNSNAVAYLKGHRNDVRIKQDIIRIITDAARGLQYLHKLEPPVVHSNIRGDNILITSSGGAVLGGFTSAQALQRTATSPPVVATTRTDSARWMAPELLEDDLPVLQLPSDIWGWAMSTLELVSGEPPYFKHKQPHTLGYHIGAGKRPLRQDHTEFNEYALQPNELWGLLENCWAYRPSDRPTVDEVIAELEKIGEIPAVESIAAPEAYDNPPLGPNLSASLEPDVEP